MVDPSDIKLDLVKLVNGDRLLRFTDPKSGLCLEKRVDPHEPVASQKKRLLAAFDAARARAQVVAA